MGPLGLRAFKPAPCLKGDRTAAALRAASTVFVGYRTDDRSALVTNGLQHRFAPAVWPLNTRASLWGWRAENRFALVYNGLQRRFAPAVWPLNTRASLCRYAVDNHGLQHRFAPAVWPWLTTASLAGAQN